MTKARFSIGIDLGTTNSALAFAPLDGDAGPDILPIPQWDSLAGVAAAPTLPSFLYLPEDAVAEQLRGRAAGDGSWIVGRLARAKAGEIPGRVVHSAKSWLCHHAADRMAAFLPWGATDLSRDEKISPVRASALILNHLRGAWDARFAEAGCAFDDQEITITVPASFDAAAQRLTLAAAEEAGFPPGARLLEEPQAAFYCWLASHDAAGEPWADPDAREPRHVLVVDIGGGTSDFSLFALRPDQGGGKIPDIRRVAVSEHILLGGDNVDLALAHLVEQRLGDGRGQISGARWDALVASCRDLKETALSGDGPADERFVVALAGRGSGLIGGTRTVAVTRAEIEGVLLDGFFPECAAAARPYRTQGALRELGLPYATDSAVTRHLADFLRDGPRVDAVLFNGGSLHPPRLRARIGAQIGAWQQGEAPLILTNAEPDLAVALGAARYGVLLHGARGKIAADAARAVFLEVHAEGRADPSLVCVLPRGARPEEAFEITEPALKLTTGRLARFQAVSSSRHGDCRAGDMLDWREGAFHALPPLQTIVKTESAGAVPVHLVAKMNALGLLAVACVSADPGPKRAWPLEFDLRAHDSGGTREVVTRLEPNANSTALEAAAEKIGGMFTGPAGKPTANTLFKALAQVLGVPRNAWNAALLRALWPALAARMDGRRLSVDHEETWLITAGFLLRPGFGVAGDEARMDALWRLHAGGSAFPGRRIKAQEYILWRRLAGGLSRARQDALLAAEIGRLRGDKAPAELVRLAGSLEYLSQAMKAELVNRFVDTAASLAREKGHCAPYLSALGFLLNRAPLYAGPETVVPPDFVQHAYDAFRALDWAAPELLEIQTMFLRAARVVDDRTVDVPKSLRLLIAGKLEKSGVPASRTARLKEFVPVGRADRAAMFDEALPPGLILAGAADS